MTVKTPLSLNNIASEFGHGVLFTQTIDSGSGTITPPANSKSAIIRIWGGGGGGGGAFGEVGSGGGGAGFVQKTISLVDVSPSRFDQEQKLITYSIGNAGQGALGVGDGGNGGNTTANILSVIYQSGNPITQSFLLCTAEGGKGGKSDRTPGIGGTATGGDINLNGSTTAVQDGGDAGGLVYGGGQGGELLDNPIGGDPGGGGIGDEQGGFDGGTGRMTIHWLTPVLSEYTRGDDFVPNHSGNSNIPTSPTNLGVSNFSGSSLNFTATVTGDGSANHGYRLGTFGSINHNQFGISRTNTDQIEVLGIYETRTTETDIFGNPISYAYFIVIEFNGDARESTLGYRPVSGAKVNNFEYLYAASGIFPTQISYNFGVTTYTIYGRSGSLGSDDWAFDQTNGVTNPVEIYFNAPETRLYLSTTSLTSGLADTNGGTPISPPSGANYARIRIWGGGAGGSGGTGGGGGGFATIEVDLKQNETFYYEVENGGNFGAVGQNGGNTSITSTLDVFSDLIAFGGIWDGTGGTTQAGFNWLTATLENGGNNDGSIGGDAGGLSYGGGVGDSGAGANPGAGGGTGFVGGEARLVIDWYTTLPIKSYY